MKKDIFDKIEKWNMQRLMAQIRGDKPKEKYASINLNRYLRKLSLPEAIVEKEA